MNILLFKFLNPVILLMITGTLFLSGCKDSKERTEYHDMTYYLSAEREFTQFIEYYISDIERILREYGMYHEDFDILGNEVIQWHIYKQPDKGNNQDQILATVTIHGEKKLYGMQLPEYMYFVFVYKDGQWCVTTENEPSLPLVSRKFPLIDITSRIYKDLQGVFTTDR
jgi:hypothetical protein